MGNRPAGRQKKMRIVCIGGGPAGLYFALLMKRADPRHDVTVIERNRPYDTFGWGVVFSDQTLGNLAAADRRTARRDPATRSTTGTTSTSTSRAARSRRAATASAASAASGCSTSCRRAARRSASSWCSRPSVDRRARACATRRRPRRRRRRRQQRAFARATPTSSSPTSTRASAASSGSARTSASTRSRSRSRRREHGWFQAHAYQFDGDTSTFIVETPEDVVAARRARPDDAGRGHRASASGCSRA